MNDITSVLRQGNGVSGDEPLIKEDSLSVAHTFLIPFIFSDSFRRRDTQKIYIAKSDRIAHDLCSGKTTKISHWLHKDRKRNRTSVVPPGTARAQPAKSTIEILSVRQSGSERGSMMKLFPETGRPHQLRVACASIGLPILGDLKYGCHHSLSKGRAIALHALELKIPHPTRREEMLCFRTPNLPFWSGKIDLKV